MKTLLTLRKNKGLTQKEIAEHLGISRQAYANYESGNREPDINTLKLLSEYFEVSIDTLLENTSKTKKGVKIPVYGNVAAGIPLEAITDIDEWEEISEDVASTGEYIALRINGDSMEPRMSRGDVVIVRLQPDVENGDMAIVLINGGEATCKKIQKTPDGILLMSINTAYAPMFYSNKQIEELPVRFLGKVVELRAKF